MKSKWILATRKSPLALKQAELVKEHLEKNLPHTFCELLGLVTTGDKLKEISLEKNGGKGLFTKEIEEALLSRQADLAIHSAKDLPTENPEGLVIAGYLKREDPSDVLISRSDITHPKLFATGSPRRREQIRTIFPEAEFKGFRGNIHTRLEKMANGDADATILAAAGLNRLGISEYQNLTFRKLSIKEMVPAVGQGAIAIQCRNEDFEKFYPLFDPKTFYAVSIERLFLASLGGGCHAGFSGYYHEGTFFVYHQKIGYQTYNIEENLSPNSIKSIIEDIAQTLSD
ncbi:MAG: hydroxymethylbilane synthase [Verrucomicrobia bacterium]|nr:MAG: hydroxymethylbilane synthase [Verrucomicrobiota bacterium]